jgi:pyridoxamine 5'-phosphate oxidase
MEQRTTDPIAKFARWLEEARRLNIPNYDAMALATSNSGGHPSIRFVLLKRVDHRGFVFFSDVRSRKGRELRANPQAALAFYWEPNGRQVRVEGRVEEVTPAESDAYWATRPRESQIAANASRQSARIGSRAELLKRVAQLERKFRSGDVPRPSYWIGFRLRPSAIEFWRHRDHRLHEREKHLQRGSEWQSYVLQP